MKKRATLFAVTAVVFFAAAVFTSCRSAPLPVEEPPPEPVVYVPEPPPPPPPEPEPCVVVYECIPCLVELSPFDAHEFERRVFEFTNRHRTMNRLPPLIWCDRAALAARAHSMDMECSDFMRHAGSDGSNGRQRLERAGINNIRRWGVSIAGGWTTPEAVVSAWMDSPRYRQNILRREFTHIGVGFIQRPEDSDSRFPTYWTQKFFVFE